MIFIKDIFKYCRLRNFKEIKYFSKDGRSMPNGVGFQRGNFFKESADNVSNFVLSKSVCEERGCQGGVIVFSAEANADLDITKISQCLATITEKQECTHSIGNAFRGRYIGTHDDVYDESSTTIEIKGLSRRNLFRLADDLARKINPKYILVKDLYRGKVYISKGLKSEK